jgi:hypothetical protein
MAFATWTGSAWRLFLVDTDAGLCEEGGEFPSFLEASCSLKGIGWATIPIEDNLP